MTMTIHILFLHTRSVSTSMACINSVYDLYLENNKNKINKNYDVMSHVCSVLLYHREYGYMLYVVNSIFYLIVYNSHVAV